MSTVQETAVRDDVAQTQAAVTAASETRKALNISRAASLIALILMIAAPFFVRNFVVFQFTQIIIYGIAIMSLNILTGASGQFSLGHSAFFAVGAYTTAILMEHGDMNYILTLPFAGAVCFIFGFLFGLPALRLSGVYLALATFSLAIAMPQFLKLGTFEYWTGGVQGLVVTKPDAPFGLHINQDVWLYYVTLTVALIMYVLSINLLNSRTGRAMMAIRDNQIAASSMGVNLALYKTLSFGISAGMTGVAGGLAAIVVAFVAPDGYSITFANQLFLAMVIGGVGWLPGSLAGGAFIVLVPNMAESISKGLAGAVFGVFIFALIFLFPNGARQAAYLGAYWIRRLIGGGK
jgi:branched-chain amino acid transport system permease protein